MADEPARPAAFGEGLRALLDALPQRRRTQLALLTVLALANAAADLLAVATAMLFLASLAGQPPALPGPLAQWVEIAPVDNPLAAAAVLFAAGALIANGVRLLNLQLSETYVAQVAHDLTMAVQRRVLAQPYEYHVRHNSSMIIGSLHSVQALAFNFIHQWLQSAAALATGLAVLGLLVTIDPLPAVTTFLAFAFLYAIIARLAAGRLAENSAAVGETHAQRIRKVQESLGAIRDLKIDHSERAQLDDLRRADARYARAQSSTGFIAAAPRYFVEMGAAALIAGLAVLLAARGSAHALVLIGGIALGGLRVLPLLQTAYRSWANMRANRDLTGQMIGLLSLPMAKDSEAEPAPLPYRQSIRLERVSFGYPEAAEPALRDISLEIAHGSRVALVGETGSGKSTLADVIMGLLRPGTGSIAVDGTPLGDAEIRAWQRNIAHVSQAIFLIDASIAANIAFSLPGKPLDTARVREAAALAGIADLVDSLPAGFDTEVGERGARLSGGQRQRIGIARALYKQAPVLVLDEATNALDAETEATVLANLFADKDRTILIIAHRPSATARCDNVIKLSNGRVVPD